MRNAFEAICNGTPGLRCCGAFADVTDLDFKLRQTNPDVVLMDIELPGTDGITATKAVVKKWPAVKILIQTVFEDDDKIFDAICAGASGYILKSTTPSRLVEAIQEVHNGGSPMSPYIASRVLKLFQQFATIHAQSGDERFGLTAREKEILALMVEGHRLQTIASRIFLSYETVRSHVKHIYKKLHVASASEAVIKAIRERLV